MSVYEVFIISFISLLTSANVMAWRMMFKKINARIDVNEKEVKEIKESQDRLKYNYLDRFAKLTKEISDGKIATLKMVHQLETNVLDSIDKVKDLVNEKSFSGVTELVKQLIKEVKK